MNPVVEIDDLPIVWKVHPFREHWVKSVAVILFLISLFTFIQSEFKQSLLTFISIAVLVGSLLRYFLPTQYKIDIEGVHYTFLGLTKTRKWTEFKTFYVCKTGVQLSPFPRPHWLDPFRGYFVLVGKDKEVIVNYIRARVHDSDYD
ncbi:MAG: hypothetical protein ACE14V_14210 [bacterium]